METLILALAFIMGAALGALQRKRAIKERNNRIAKEVVRRIEEGVTPIYPREYAYLTPSNKIEVHEAVDRVTVRRKLYYQ